MNNDLTDLINVLDTSPVSRYLSDLWDGNDLWGSAMAEGFALCDWLTFEAEAGAEIPAELGYRPAPGGAETDSAMWEYVCAGYDSEAFTVADVVDYLPLLNRFLDACKAHGLDY